MVGGAILLSYLRLRDPRRLHNRTANVLLELRDAIALPHTSRLAHRLPGALADLHDYRARDLVLLLTSLGPAPVHFDGRPHELCACSLTGLRRVSSHSRG